MSISAEADVIQRSLQLLAAHRNELTAHFFGRLFGRHPELEVYFVDSKPEWLERKFASALRAIMQAATSPAEFEKQLGSLRATHEGRSVDAAHFALFGDVLIESLAYYGGRGWTSEVELAWRSVMGKVVDAMAAPHEYGDETDQLVTGHAVA